MTHIHVMKRGLSNGFGIDDTGIGFDRLSKYEGLRSGKGTPRRPPRRCSGRRSELLRAQNGGLDGLVTWSGQYKAGP